MHELYSRSHECILTARPPQSPASRSHCTRPSLDLRSICHASVRMPEGSCASHGAPPASAVMRVLLLLAVFLMLCVEQAVANRIDVVHTGTANPFENGGTSPWRMDAFIDNPSLSAGTYSFAFQAGSTFEKYDVPTTGVVLTTECTGDAPAVGVMTRSGATHTVTITSLVFCTNSISLKLTLTFDAGFRVRGAKTNNGWAISGPGIGTTSGSNGTLGAMVTGSASSLSAYLTAGVVGARNTLRIDCTFPALPAWGVNSFVSIASAQLTDLPSVTNDLSVSSPATRVTSTGGVTGSTLYATDVVLNDAVSEWRVRKHATPSLSLSGLSSVSLSSCH